MRAVLTILGIAAVVMLFCGCSSVQRKLLYFPSHQTGGNGLSEWKHRELLLRDNWNNIEALAKYEGPLEIFGAKDDTVIPITHAKALAATKPKALFHEIEGGHNNWSYGPKVEIRNP